MGEKLGLGLRELPPVQSLVNGVDGLPTPTFCAARRAPSLPPVYVFASGLGAAGALEKAKEAPRKAASRTLYCVSPA
jgi:hypothetical protein